MSPSKEELAAQYERLATGELLRRFESGSLIPVALEVVRDELLARGVKLDAPVEDPSPSPAEYGKNSFEFVTVAQIVNPVKANLLKMHLESEGVEVHMIGEHLGVVHISLSTAAGGIRVQVRSDQLDRAKEVLARFDQIEKEIQDSKFEQADSDAERHKAEKRAEKRRASLDRPATPVFFWLFTILALGVVFFLIAVGGRS